MVGSCVLKKGNNSCALCVQALQLKNLPKIGRVLKGNGKKFAQLELRFKMLRDSKHYCLQRVQIYNKMLLLYNMYSDYNQLVFELVARQQRINRGVYLCLIFEMSI